MAVCRTTDEVDASLSIGVCDTTDDCTVVGVCSIKDEDVLAAATMLTMPAVCCWTGLEVGIICETNVGLGVGNKSTVLILRSSTSELLLVLAIAETTCAVELRVCVGVGKTEVGAISTTLLSCVEAKLEVTVGVLVCSSTELDTAVPSETAAMLDTAVPPETAAVLDTAILSETAAVLDTAVLSETAAVLNCILVLSSCNSVEVVRGDETVEGVLVDAAGEKEFSTELLAAPAVDTTTVVVSPDIS